MMAVTKFGVTHHDCELMQYGEWVCLFDTYKYIYNFEAKQALYSDAEEETQRLIKLNRKIDSVMDL